MGTTFGWLFCLLFVIVTFVSGLEGLFILRTELLILRLSHSRPAVDVIKAHSMEKWVSKTGKVTTEKCICLVLHTSTGKEFRITAHVAGHKRDVSITWV